jgi:hypothetical protein
MPDDTGKGTPRKEVRDAAGEMARAGAAEVSWQTSRRGRPFARQWNVQVGPLMPASRWRSDRPNNLTR